MTPRLWAFLCTPMKLMYFSQIIKNFKLHYDFFFYKYTESNGSMCWERLAGVHQGNDVINAALIHFSPLGGSRTSKETDDWLI